MRPLTICVLVLYLLNYSTITVECGEFKTLSGNVDAAASTTGRTTFSFVLDEDAEGPEPRYKREINSTLSSETATNETVVNIKLTYLNDRHKQLMVHWVGEDSKVVICLARDPVSQPSDFQETTPSSVFISYDDGETYHNQSDQFRLPNGSYATLDKFYNHPRDNTHFVFTDITHNVLFITTNHGKNFSMVPLRFTPSELSFHEQHSNIFVILDKHDPHSLLYVTEDFGQSFRQAHEFVKSFHWVKLGDKLRLLVFRNEPNGLGSLLHTHNLFRNRFSEVYATNIKDFFIKGDYLFSTKNNSKGKLELYVSYKLSQQSLCELDTTLPISNYFIADVTGDRALVVASHSPTTSHLYVSGDLTSKYGKGTQFTLSLEDVYAFFPNVTGMGSILQRTIDEPFVDVYKVEGLNGIYIASRVLSNPPNNNLGLLHVGSVITFDHGATWRLIQAPAVDLEGQVISCTNNCSLHLSQRFNQFFPESRSAQIMSSKSAPGTIIATGVLGQNLKGHYAVYISVDGGVTWKQTLRDLHFFNMGDHGGIMTAVKFYYIKGETKHIQYSINEGESWDHTQFHNEDMRIYGLMTEPGENKTVFTMFGSLPSTHQWIIVKVDFANVFKRTCGDDDYKMWSPSYSEDGPSYIPCVMGQQTVYQRRLRHANCLNGLDYVRILDSQNCDCDARDFECDYHFKKPVNPNYKRCIFDQERFKDYDPYAAPSYCRPGKFYDRSKGYRKIVGDTCVGGFQDLYLPDTVPCPFEEGNNFLLFAQREAISVYDLVSHKLESLPIKNVKNVIAIDFDMAENCVFWADINLDTINRQCFSNGSKLETLVSHELASIEGMAFDWISKLLYFVDGSRGKIEMIRTDISHSGRMRRVVLDNNVVKKPRGIAVHPQAGYMFWTDWSPEQPSVNRANLDGTGVKILFGHSKVEWPNGITVDYIANRIYWVDARNDYIGSSDLHGNEFHNVVHSSDVVSHPFGIAVFKNNLYWDDWKKNAIYSSDKDVYKGVNVVVKELQGLMDLKVYAHGLQIGTNACVNATCSHICVGMPKNRFACLCPDRMQLSKDGTSCLCPGGDPPLANGTCRAVGNSCATDYFTCASGLCISKGWRCDGEDDCGDNSDEMKCGGSTCPKGFHVCGDGKCLPHYWKCDYDKDCVDGSDEANCQKQNCTERQFQCGNGRCISKNWRCDGENDCRDNSDELNCDPVRPANCKGIEEFQCASGAVTCIPSTWKCDGEPDCRDGSDENKCENNVCSESQFSCGPPSNRCIFNTWVCDGDKDCVDGKDEMNCTLAKPAFKPPNGFQKSKNCHDWMFTCQNDRCIPFWWKCDDVDDCGDNSDELNCPDTKLNVPQLELPTTKAPTVVCNKNEFRCNDNTCILQSWVCDGSYDCRNGEDEKNCEETACSSDHFFRCVIDGDCIPRHWVCDGTPNCPDKSDEAYCSEGFIPNEPATPSCSVGFFPCDGGKCYPLSYICNGVTNCMDGYDEKSCSKKQRIWQVEHIDAYYPERFRTSSDNLFVYWTIKNDSSFQYLPSISKVNDKTWQNTSWTDQTQYVFRNLSADTLYNVTVYVRENNKTTVFPPSYYRTFRTTEAQPSPPQNVKLEQLNSTHLRITWEKPSQPNGEITHYQIVQDASLAPPIAEINGKELSYVFSQDFESKLYRFSVIAFNTKFKGKPSIPASIMFNARNRVGSIKGVGVNVNNSSVQLSWVYDGPADVQFAINVTSKLNWPKLPSYTTSSRNITIVLGPGETYTLIIYAFRGTESGPKFYLDTLVSGSSLPLVRITKALVDHTAKPVVHLTWDRPEGDETWEYGVYYNAKYMPTHPEVKLRTTALNATITDLEACERYLVLVGVIGPRGYGPISSNSSYSRVILTNTTDPRQPPKAVKVVSDPKNSTKIIISWQPSCFFDEGAAYIIDIKETVWNKLWKFRVNQLNHTMAVVPGGNYHITVSANVAGAYQSTPVVYNASPLNPPNAVNVIPEGNGSFFVYWSDKSDVPNEPFKYEVLVQDGTSLDPETAQRFIVNGPPFIYTNNSASIYTFAVRIKTTRGYTSMLSETLSKISESQIAESSVNLPAYIIPTLMALALIGVIAFLVVRNRRLHNSFVRFASSHYNSRSGAATFDDNALDEEDSPRIVGFADDEPLVVA